MLKTKTILAIAFALFTTTITVPSLACSGGKMKSCTCAQKCHCSSGKHCSCKLPVKN